MTRVHLLPIAIDAVRSLARQPLRSLLTASASAVAIAVTVNVISLVYGLDEDLRRDTAHMGRRTVDVTRLPVLVPGRKRAPLGEAERETVDRLVRGLGCVVVPRRLVSGSAVGAGRVESLGVVAVSPAYPTTLDVPIAAGRFFADDDPDDGVCVLDESLAAGLFPGVPVADVPGRFVRLTLSGGTGERRVVGLLSDPLTHRALFEAFDEGRDARTLTSALLSFRNVYVPEGTLSGSAEYSGISVVAPRESAVDEVLERLRDTWPLVAPDEAFPTSGVGVFARRDWMDLIGETSRTGALLGNAMWMIIVGVAGVMIATLNLLVIRERYDELAIRRVEGAGRADIAWHITVEGVVTSVVGGLAGLPLGYAGAAMLRRIVDVPFRFEARYALIATLVAIGLGLVASVLPARRAASLDPVRVLTRRPT